MKKFFIASCVIAALFCSTLANAVTWHESVETSGTPVAKVMAREASNSNVGVSIGTVDAQLYSESGLTLSNFGNAEYLAKTSEGTYMGFTISTGIYVYDSETGEETYYDGKYASFVAIMSSEESVTIPDNIKVGEEVIPVFRIYSSSYLQYGFTENIKNLTIPETINYIGGSYSFDQYLEGIYMLGKAPDTGFYVNASAIYVCNKSNFSSYTNNYYYSNTSILPYGWDYEWITVNVEKNGEFAETYLTQNDYDWGAAQYVKVTGNINDTDLSAIKNLTSLMKLDLSETIITELPSDFMYNRTSLLEVKLPSTVTEIGSSAFRGCTRLQSFDLNGITEIKSYAFYGCKSLSYINLNGVQTIGDYAFYECSKLNNLDLSTVISTGSYSFAYCNMLESVDLSSAIIIGYDSFLNCTALKSVVLGDNLQNIYYGSFYNTAIEAITIPNTLNSIDDEVFYNCKNLKSVEIPSSVTSIGYRAFYGCTALEEITIPATVTSIGSNAFNNTGIKTFKCYAAVPPTASNSFIGSDMDMSRTYLYVPPFSKDFYRNTDYWSDFYLMRSIEDSIDYILVDRPLTINLEEEDNAVVANNPTIDLSYDKSKYYYDDNGNSQNCIGQLTATGEGTLSAGQLTISGQLSRRSRTSYQYVPTLINYADKMRADNVTHNLTFYNYNGSGEWHFISLPYDVKVSDIVPSEDTYWVIRRYDSAARAAGDTSSTWVNLTNDDTLEAGKGYIVSAYAGYDENGYVVYPALSFTSGNSITKNNLFRQTDIIVSLTEYAAEFAHNRSWNFVGNPYPCYFDMHYLNEEFTAPVTVWNGSAYVAYSPVDDDLVLSPYEAFFVQCPLDATEMTFKEEGRMHSDEGKSMYKSPAKSSPMPSVEERNVFNFELSGENYEDRARIVFNSEAKLEYEIGRDASKFFADNSEDAQIYVNADVAYSINERPVGDGLATLGIRSANEKLYTLSLSGKYSDEWSVMLTDNETDVTVDLTKGSYQFTSSSNENASRFSVKFSIVGNGATGIASILSEFGEDTNVTVTSVNGVVVYNGRLSDIQVPTSGLYLISNGNVTRKAILK